MKKLKDYLIENKFEFISVIILSIFFYLQMVNAGISTHDELQNIYFVRTGQFFSHLTWERWGMTLMNILPSYVHALCVTPWMYRIFTMFGLLASCIAFSVAIKKCIGRKASWLMMIFFFLFAQFQLDHNGLYSFSFSYQLNTCYVFIAFSLYHDFLKNRKKRYLISSALLYLMSSMAYEAFVLYGAIFFLMDLMYWIDKKNIKVKLIFKDLILHASLVIGYVISYFVISSISGIENADATIGTGIKIKEIIVTTWKLAIGMFPLNYRQYNLSEFIKRSFEVTTINVVQWVLIIFIMVAVYKAIKKAEVISNKKYVRATIICFVGMILPGVLVAITNKFINWIYHGGVKSFGVSYYSYFFIVAWLVITMIFLYQKVPFKKLFLFISIAIIAFVSQCTFINNKIYIDYLANQEKKYDLYCDIVETQYFKAIEDGSQIYAPDYIGIHYNMQTLSIYANTVAGTNIIFTNDRNQLNFNNPVYYLMLDTVNNALYLSKVNEDGLTNEVFVKKADSLLGYGIIANRSDDYAVNGLFINDRLENIYGTEIISGDIHTEDSTMIVKCDGMIADSFEIYAKSGKYNNGLISISDIWPQESWGRWAKKDCSIIVDNKDDLNNISLNLKIATPGQDGSTLRITCGEYSEDFIINGLTDVNLVIPIIKGKNEIKLSSSAPDIIAEGDPREMNIQILDIICIYDKFEFNINK